MTNKTYEVRIQLPGGRIETQTVQAGNPHVARKLVEMQFKGCKVVGNPKEVRK